MGAERSPAFLFFPAAFLTDMKSACMPYESRGHYITLLCFEWLEGTLPAAPADLADLLKVPRRRFEPQWEEHLQRCFEARGARLVNARLELERQRQHARQVADVRYHERRRTIAAQGAAARWGRKW